MVFHRGALNAICSKVLQPSTGAAPLSDIFLRVLSWRCAFCQGLCSDLRRARAIGFQAKVSG